MEIMWKQTYQNTPAKADYKSSFFLRLYSPTNGGGW